MQVDTEVFTHSESHNLTATPELHLSQPGQINYTSNTLNQYTEIDRDGTVSSPSYDDDGNMTDDGTRIFTWNGENRLVSAAPKTPVDGDKKAEFIYDYMGRRVKKNLYSYSAASASSSWQLEKEMLFVYDGWDLIREISVASGVQSIRDFVWGLDLSGTLHGAGGVGGLVAMVDQGNEYLYFYDANGNVGQLVKSSDGSVAAHYEYDPYGNLTASHGEYSAENPFRFSTKYKDDETGLGYWGYRYYSAELGRWLNQDPLSEIGSMLLRRTPNIENNNMQLFEEINLYSYVEGDPVNAFDPEGLYVMLCSRELGDRDKPATAPNKLLRHDYLNVSGYILSFQSGSNMLWSQGRVEQGKYVEHKDGGRCHMICDDPEFDKYVMMFADYVPQYCILGFNTSLTSMAGIRQCQTWASTVIEYARKNYLEIEDCPKCFK